MLRKRKEISMKNKIVFYSWRPWLVWGILVLFMWVIGGGIREFQYGIAGGIGYFIGVMLWFLIPYGIWRWYKKRKMGKKKGMFKGQIEFIVFLLCIVVIAILILLISGILPKP
jgi:uncharacterized membrane protein YidH (DUF202 family)